MSFFRRHDPAFVRRLDATINRGERFFVFLVEQRRRIVEVDLLRLSHTFTIVRAFARSKRIRLAARASATA
jgi:hypothetical protein